MLELIIRGIVGGGMDTGGYCFDWTRDLGTDVLCAEVEFTFFFQCDNSPFLC